MKRILRWSGAHHGWLLLAIVAWFAFTAWMRPLSVPDEGRYAGVAWTMAQGGDWLTPRLNGLPFFHKPPLFYWIAACAIQVFGANEWSARLPSVLGAAATAFSLYLFVHRWAGRARALVVLAVLLTTPLFFVGSQFANLDMLVAGCISTAILLLAHAALHDLRHGVRDRRALAAGYTALALGVLAKGLIGLVLPGLVLVSWLVVLRKPRVLLGLVWLPGLLLFAVLTVPWFAAMQARHPDFLHYFFVVQHFQRFATGGFNNPQPFWFYGAALLLLGLPWTGWMWAAVYRQSPHDASRQLVRWLMVVWLVLVVGFFSIPRSKLVGYVLPAVAPMAFLLGDALRMRMGRPAATTRWEAWSLGLAAVVCIGAPWALARWPTGSTRSLAHTLLALRMPGEPVLFIGDFYHDVPFYARLSRPVGLVQPWDDPKLRQRDNWVKEIADASQFDMPAAKGVLLTPAQLSASLCAQPVSWIMAPSYAPAIYPLLVAARPVASVAGTHLWRVDSHAPDMAALLRCPAFGPSTITPAER